MLALTMTLSQSLDRNRPAKVRTCYTLHLFHLLTLLASSAGTLLNRLFGTNFDVMAESQRQQTTKGMGYPQ